VTFGIQIHVDVAWEDKNTQIIYVMTEKVIIRKSFDVELSTWRPHDRLSKNPSILALVNRFCGTLNYIINV
jgi:hypothetical protein